MFLIKTTVYNCKVAAHPSKFTIVKKGVVIIINLIANYDIMINARNKVMALSWSLPVQLTSVLLPSK